MYLHANRAIADRGFTIVELLIVIVVIAILSAISIVAFNGIQDRSKTSSTNMTVAQLHKAVLAYVAINGTAPLKAALPVSGTWLTDYACIGKGFTDVNSDGRGDCFINVNNTGDSVSSNVQVDAALASSGFQSNGQYPEVRITDGTVTYKTNGAWLAHWGNNSYVNGESSPLLFAYWLKGTDKKCDIKPQIVLQSTSGGNEYYVSDGSADRFASAPYDGTLCAVHIK